MQGALDEIGWIQRVVINKRTGHVIDGHLRIELALRQRQQVPVLYVDLSDNEEKLALATFDPLSAMAIADKEMLAGLLDEVSTDNESLQKMLEELADEQGLKSAPTEGLTDEDDIPEVEEDPVTCPGDVWLLGQHRLLCGSATEAEQVAQLLNGQAPNTMITDPPYGVRYEAAWRAQAKGRKKTSREETSRLSNDDQADWYAAYALFGGTVAYVWHASAFTDVVMEGLRRAGFAIKQQIIWNKNVHALSRSDYHWKHEPCWYALREAGSRNWNGGRSQMTVWDIPSVIFEEGKTAHPTQKPVALYERAILNHTNPGEYLYEPFCGSGTAVIACEKLDRRCLALELDPRFVDLIIQRWQDFTGKAAVREADGRPFSELVC